MKRRKLNTTLSRERPVEYQVWNINHEKQYRAQQPAVSLGKKSNKRTPARPTTPNKAATTPLPASPSSNQIRQQSRKASLPTIPREYAQLSAVLQEKGFTADVMGSLPTETIAKSLSLFHHGVAKELFRDKLRVPNTLRAVLMERPIPQASETSASQKLPSPNVFALCGNDANVHWVTRLVLSHLLGVPVDLRAEHIGNVQASESSRLRGKVMARWIQVGQYCREAGDECTWMAIRTAIYSRPVLRLFRTWREVPVEAHQILRRWETGKRQSIRLPPRTNIAVQNPWTLSKSSLPRGLGNHSIVPSQLVDYFANLSQSQPWLR